MYQHMLEHRILCRSVCNSTGLLLIVKLHNWFSLFFTRHSDPINVFLSSKWVFLISTFCRPNYSYSVFASIHRKLHFIYRQLYWRNRIVYIIIKYSITITKSNLFTGRLYNSTYLAFTTYDNLCSSSPPSVIDTTRIEEKTMVSKKQLFASIISCEYLSLLKRPR